MPSEIYELVARAARYWFLLLMALIVWRSYRWYRRDRRQAKKRLKLLPDAGFVGEMVVMQGNESLKRGQALPVPWEGTLGALRTNDLCVPVEGVGKRHLWFRFDEDEGLMVEPLRGRTAQVDGEEFKSRREPLYMAHGSRLFVGKAELRLRLFAGFEGGGYAPRRDGAAENAGGTPPENDRDAAMAQQLAMQQWMIRQQWMIQRQLEQQKAYQQWLMQRQAAAPPPRDRDASYEVEEEAGASDAAFGRDDSVFMRPAGEPVPDLIPEGEEPARTEFEPREPFYPPEPDGGDWPYAPYPQSDAEWEDLGYTYPDLIEPGEVDEDLTDAAAPPKSAYVGHDEAERAKRKLWDKYFGGGHAR